MTETIDEIAAKIAELRKKEKAFRQKYGCDYKTFYLRVEEDEEYISTIEKNVTKLWGNDLANLEFHEKGIEDWMKKM